MFSFSEGFQAQNVLTFFLFSMKRSKLLTGKLLLTLAVYGNVRFIGDMEYFATNLKEYKIISRWDIRLYHKI